MSRGKDHFFYFTGKQASRQKDGAALAVHRVALTRKAACAGIVSHQITGVDATLEAIHLGDHIVIVVSAVRVDNHLVGFVLVNVILHACTVVTVANGIIGIGKEATLNISARDGTEDNIVIKGQ